MKRSVFFLFTGLLVMSMLSSCRPPELEGAYVDFNAGRFDSALDNAEKAIKLYPANPEAWFMLGRLYGKKDRFGEMVEAFDKSISLGNQFESKIKEEKNYYFQTVFNKGVGGFNKYVKEEDSKSEKAQKILASALDNFLAAKTIRPEYPAALLIARSYNLLDKKDEATAEYKEMTKLYPDSAQPWLEIGKVHFFAEDYKNCVPNFEKALEKDAVNVEAISFLSQAYDKLEDTDNAIKAYEQAIQLNKTEPAFPFNLGLIYNRLANTEGIDEETKKAHLQKIVENFALVVEIDPEQKVGYEMKSYAEIQLQKNADAVETINAALERFPNESSLWFNLGVALTNDGQTDEGKKAFDKAKELGYE